MLILIRSNGRWIISRFAASALAVVLLCLLPAFSQDTETEALRHFREAQKAQNEGSLEIAAQEYSKVIQLLPEAAEAYASLGLVYNAEGRFADSERALRKAEKLKPGMPGVSLYLGIDDVKMRHAGLAIPYLREAVRLEPSKKEAQTWLSTALWDDGQIQGALKQFLAVSRLFPSDPVLLLDLGEAYRKAAEDQIQQILLDAKGTPLLHQVYGDIYRDERVWQNARAHYFRAIDQDPHWQGAHFGLGEVALRNGKLDDAKQEYRRELEINPRSAAALARLAEISLLQNDPETALTLLSSAIAIAPEQASNALGLPHRYPPFAEGELGEAEQSQFRKSLPVLESAPKSAARTLALAIVNRRIGDDSAFASDWKAFQDGARYVNSPDPYKRGVSRFDRQDFYAAEGDLNVWLKQHPRDLQARYLLARTYQCISLSTLAQLLEASPDSYPAHKLLAETYESADKDEDALGEHKTVEKMAPNLPGVHFSVGNLLLKMGHQEEAVEELATELRLNPDHAEANAEMGQILLDRGKPSEAIPYLEKAIQMDPDRWSTLSELAKAYYKQKDFTKAEAVLQQTVQHDTDGSVHYQLAMVYRALGRTEAAKEQLEMSRKLKLAGLSHSVTEMTTIDSLPQ